MHQGRASLADDGVRFHFHQHLRRNQAAHLHHARRRPNPRPKNSPCARPTFTHPRCWSHKSASRTTSFSVAPALARARLNIPNRLPPSARRRHRRQRFSIRRSSGRSRNADYVAHPHRPRIPHNRLPARNISDETRISPAPVRSATVLRRAHA